jgi:L-seryl-tRNA(Ser) seleniumtransferase
MKMADLRSLPSVDRLIQTPQAVEWIMLFGRPLTLEAIRFALEESRQKFLKGDPAVEIPGEAALLLSIGRRLQDWTAPTLHPVINATGVILHTNLGRAPLSQEAALAAMQVASGYSTLEYDLEKGQRGSRLVHAETLLKRLTGAEAALVVNNNAAAVLLALTGLAHRRAVVIPRSQLVEIGGGFRIPDVMKQSGARLLEIGTTNRIHLSDFEAALAEKPALFMRAHRSNFTILGFTSEPSLSEIASVAHQAGLPLVDDLGSGTLLDTSRFGLAHEPMVQESLAAGADLVCFSGDKLLGGPQAGIIVGRLDLIARLRKHPLARAIRADKFCLAALNATLLHYLKNEAEHKVPIWRMISAPVADLRARAEAWAAHLYSGAHLPQVPTWVQVLPGESTVGGGSLPGETLPTVLLVFSPRNPTQFVTRLRQADPPVICRLQEARVLLDPRTVLAEQEESLLSVLAASLAGQ